MKTFVKICCGVLAFGLILSAVGLACGGQSLTAAQFPGLYRAVRSLDYTFDRLDRWGWYTGRWTDRFMDDAEDWTDRVVSQAEDWADKYADRWEHDLDDLDDLDDWEDWDGTLAGALPAEYYDSVKHIELQLAEGRYELRTADPTRGETPYTVDGTYFKHLHTGMNDDNTWRADVRGDGNDERIIIYLPADTTYREIEIALGAGALDAGALTCDELSLSVGAGKAALDTVSADKIDVEVGAGEASLAVDARWDDCGYSAEVGLGSIKVNGKTLLLGVGESSRKGSPMLDLEAGAGAITITTNS